MNLKTLALAACCLLMPAVASSQDSMGMMSGKDSMKMHKDSMKMHKDSMKMDDKKMDGTSNRGKRVRGTRRSARAVEATGDTGARGQMTMTGGPECARGCPASKGAVGLTGVQFLALQQELRDRGCGNNHVTGWLDAPTRAAIRTCAQRLNVANDAAAVLKALNIGY